MMLVLFQPQVTGGSLIIAATVAGLAVAVWQISKVGATTVQLWQSRAEALEADLKDTTGELNLSKQTVKAREVEIAELRARPDTERVYRIVQDHHAENQAILQRLAEVTERSAETQATAMQMLEVLVQNTGDRPWDGHERRSPS